MDNRLRYLPEITAKAVASVDWATKLAEIARGYGLHMDEVEDLQSVVMRSMVGMIAPNDFESQLIAALALSPANAEKMISEINAKVFQPIHDFVMAGGKEVDGMVNAGLHVEEPATSDTFQTNTSPSFANANATSPYKGEDSGHSQEITNELVLPEITKSAPIGGVPLPPLPRGGVASEASDGGVNEEDDDDLFADSGVIEVQ